MPRQRTLKALIKELDRVFAIWIKNRDSWMCITCPKMSRDPRKMNAGHYVSRRHMSLRWDEKNVHAQCVGCNCYKSGALDVYALALQRRYGPNILKELNAKKNQIKRWTPNELIELTKKYAKDLRDH